MALKFEQHQTQIMANIVQIFLKIIIDIYLMAFMKSIMWLCRADTSTRSQDQSTNVNI